MGKRGDGSVLGTLNKWSQSWGSKHPSGMVTFLVNIGLIVSMISMAEADERRLSRGTLPQRVFRDVTLYDEAKILENIEEYSRRFLSNLRKRYGIDAVIISVSSLKTTESIKKLAVELMQEWQIGAESEEKGLLLLLAAKERQAKPEVSYELEDVFTDLFCGTIEDLQLRPYFLNGQIGTGLIAVMEEIEQRAILKHQQTYTRDEIERMDQALLSGGAGATRNFSRFNQEVVKEAAGNYPVL